MKNIAYERKLMATKCLHGLLASSNPSAEIDPSDYASLAVSLADALLVELDKDPCYIKGEHLSIPDDTVIPSWVNWIAVDKSGDVFGYENKPLHTESDFEWNRCESDFESKIKHLFNVPASADDQWKTKLYCRAAPAAFRYHGQRLDECNGSKDSAYE